MLYKHFYYFVTEHNMVTQRELDALVEKLNNNLNNFNLEGFNCTPDPSSRKRTTATTTAYREYKIHKFSPKYKPVKRIWPKHELITHNFAYL